MEKQRPLVSIIIPVYNSEAHLEGFIQSAIGQTYDDLEIIVIDDGCTDSSPDIICKYMGLDDRIKCIYKSNEGLVKARKDGIGLARGKYIQYLDSDDTLQQNAIDLLVASDEEVQADIVIAPFYFCEGEKQWLSAVIEFEEMTGLEYLKYILSFKAYWAVWAKFHLRSLYLNNIERLDIAFGEDAVLSSQLLLYSKKVVSIDTPILNYGIFPSSMSHCLDDKTYKDFNVYVSWFDDYMNRNNLAVVLKRELALFHLKNTMMRLHWRKLIDTDKEMGRVLEDLGQFPDLEEYLSNREKKIVAVYRISSRLGYLNLLRYSWQNKI